MVPAGIVPHVFTQNLTSAAATCLSADHDELRQLGALLPIKLTLRNRLRLRQHTTLALYRPEQAQAAECQKADPKSARFW